MLIMKVLDRNKKKEKKKEEEERKLREEEENRLKKEREDEQKREEQERLELRRSSEKSLKRSSIIEKLDPEPEKGEGVTIIIIRTSTGEKYIRRFKFDDPLEKLFNYVETIEPLDSWRLLSLFPKKVIKLEDTTFEKCGLTPQMTVFVEEIIGDPMYLSTSQ